METQSADRDVLTDLESLFDADNYLYFLRDDFHGEERTKLELKFLHDNLHISKHTSVLDLACGHGRHANVLARDARHVVGLDSNTQFIKLARRQAAEQNITNVTFIEQDIRHLALSDEFERATLLNTVLGLFSDEENLDLLYRINRALKTSGLLCFDVINRDTILLNLQHDSITEKEGNFLLDRLSFNERTGRMTNRRVYIKDGHAKNANFSMRLYNFTEVSGLLKAARFEIVSAFADWGANPMDWNAKKIVIVARKTGNAA